MLPKPPPCAGCPLEQKGLGFSEADGTGRSGIMLLGEALGIREAQTGKPFVGEAGVQLNRVLQFSRLSRDDFVIDNCIRCKPPGDWLRGAPWEREALDHCKYYLSTIDDHATKVIVALGDTALRETTGLSGIVMPRCPKRGYVYKMHTLVVPTVHPSFVMRGNQNWTWVMIQDLKRAEDVARNGWKSATYTYLDNLTDFMVGAADAARGGRWLAADIETDTSVNEDEENYGEIKDAHIWRVSFAYEGGRAVSVPWPTDDLSKIQEVFDLPWDYVIFHNADFDVPRLKGAGLRIGSKILDSMWLWHYYQSDLPKSLGFIAPFFTTMDEWKSKSDEDPWLYSCKDADATVQCTYGLRDALGSRFAIYERHWIELDPILKRMTQNGVLIDSEKRTAFRAKVEAELIEADRRIQDAVPLELKPFKVRARVPADVDLGTPTKDGWWDVNEHGEWGIREAFKYNSSPQVIKYIRSQGHAVPTDSKTRKETTSKDKLQSLAKRYPKDPLYSAIVEARELRKVLGQYIDGYEPGPDGRIHASFNQEPSTLRLASQRPNMQNVIKRQALAKAYRSQFVSCYK